MFRTIRAYLAALSCGAMLVVALPVLADVGESPSLLEVFAAPPANRTIIVGEVVGAQHGAIVNPNGRTRIRPRIEVSVLNVLAGHAESVEEFWGQNSFEFRHERWSPHVIEGAPWLVPGNTVLIIVDDFDGSKSVSGAPIVRRQIRNAWFLMDAAPTNDSSIYRLSGVDFVNLDACASSQAAPLEALLNTVQQRFEKTDCTLGDVVGKLAEQGGAK